MDFSLSEHQSMLKDSVGRYLSKEYSLRARRHILEQEGGFSAKSWASLAELGWLAAAFPEDVGGLGGEGLDVALLMEAFGPYLLLEPFVSTAVVGGRLLLRGVGEPHRQTLIERLVTGDLKLALAALERGSGYDLAAIDARAQADGEGFRLTGLKPWAIDGGVADAFVVSARHESGGITLFLVDRHATGLNLRTYRTHDGRTAAALALDGVAVGPDALIGPAGGGLALLEEAFDWGTAAICGECVGAMGHLVEATNTYLKQREQYGRPLAQFQALQHRMAEMYVATELARSMLYAAADSLARPAEERACAVSAAMAHIGRSALAVAEEAVQLHGGMGMSEELDIAHHLKRMLVDTRLFGDPAWHTERFAQLTRRLEVRGPATASAA